MKTRRSTYQKPATSVITLRQRYALLSESPGVNATLRNYGDAKTEDWGESE